MGDLKNESVNKSQVFYQGNLPGGLYRLRNQASLKISGVRNNEEHMRGLDINQLISIARKYRDNWEALPNAAVDPALARDLNDPDRCIGVTVPEALFAQPFPLMLRCTSCKTLDYFRGRKDDEKLLGEMLRNTVTIGGKKRIGCRRSGCSGYMRQVPYSAVHRCGLIRPMTIPGGLRRTVNIGFDESGSSIAESKFFNVDNPSGDKYSAHQDKCSTCKTRYGEAMGTPLRAVPITNPEQLFPHNTQYLSLSKRAGELFSLITGHLGAPDAPLSKEGADIARGILHCLTDRADTQELVDLTESLNNRAGEGEEDVEVLRTEIRSTQETRDKMLVAAPDESTRKITETVFEGQLNKLRDKLTLAAGKFSDTAVFEDTEIGLMRDMGSNRRALEAILLPWDPLHKRETAEQLSRVVSPSHQVQLETDNTHLNERYHIREVAHYRTINVVLASIGFTREKKDPPEGVPGSVVPLVLNGYRDSYRQAENPKSFIYALPAETEAIEVKLDPTKVLNWCIKAAGWEDPGSKITDSPEASMEYLLKQSRALRMEPMDVIRETRNDPLRDAAPFHLLHSISHCLIGSIKRHTGYDEKTVSEYLMPMNLSVLLYVSSVQNYTSGGLRMLFEHYLSAWLDDASNFALSCAFDPICSDKGSSCSGCVKFVLGCEAFNHGLSRAYIHGGKVVESSEVVISRGFWS